MAFGYDGVRIGEIEDYHLEDQVLEFCKDSYYKALDYKWTRYNIIHSCDKDSMTGWSVTQELHNNSNETHVFVYWGITSSSDLSVVTVLQFEYHFYNTDRLARHVGKDWFNFTMLTYYEGGALRELGHSDRTYIRGTGTAHWFGSLIPIAFQDTVYVISFDRRTNYRHINNQLKIWDIRAFDKDVINYGNDVSLQNSAHLLLNL